MIDEGYVKSSPPIVLTKEKPFLPHLSKVPIVVEYFEPFDPNTKVAEADLTIKLMNWEITYIKCKLTYHVDVGKYRVMYRIDQCDMVVWSKL